MPHSFEIKGGWPENLELSYECLWFTKLSMTPSTQFCSKKVVDPWGVSNSYLTVFSLFLLNRFCIAIEIKPKTFERERERGKEGEESLLRLSPLLWALPPWWSAVNTHFIFLALHFFNLVVILNVEEHIFRRQRPVVHISLYINITYNTYTYFCIARTGHGSAHLLRQGPVPGGPGLSAAPGSRCAHVGPGPLGVSPDVYRTPGQPHRIFLIDNGCKGELKTYGWRNHIEEASLFWNVRLLQRIKIFLQELNQVQRESNSDISKHQLHSIMFLFWFLYNRKPLEVLDKTLFSFNLESHFSVSQMHGTSLESVVPGALPPVSQKSEEWRAADIDGNHISAYSNNAKPRRSSMPRRAADRLLRCCLPGPRMSVWLWWRPECVPLFMLWPIRFLGIEIGA
jgi:hypothetical protein